MEELMIDTSAASGLSRPMLSKTALCRVAELSTADRISALASPALARAESEAAASSWSASPRVKAS